MLCAVIASAACTGTDTGNPYPQRLTVSAHSSDTGAFAVRIPDGGGVVAEAWLSLDPLGLIADGDAACDTGIAGGDGPIDLGVADHGAGDTTLDITLTAGDYCAMTLPFTLAAAPLPAGAPAELDGASITLTGTTAAGTDFVIASDLTAEITLTGPGALAFDEDLGPLFLGFDVAAWLAGVDIDGAGADPVLIDPAINADLLADFEANLAAGVELYRDLDGDGAAGPGDELIAAGQ
jgi:hypothetical protein